MEFHKEQWAALLADEQHGGWLVPIFALAHEHDPDPEMRPYKEAISAEEREKLIVGAAAGVTGIYRYFEAQRLVEKQPLDDATTFRRTLPKIGRNDPCPCGSGKEIQAVLWKDYAPLNCFIYRHTAICMRIIFSEGQVNIFNLAKNAGTSVDQIERFYARNLPLSKEMAINLQSFGSG